MKRILIVEDEPLFQDAVREALKSKRWRLSFCADGKQAVETALKNPPDLLLLDLALPGMNGIQIYQLLKQQKKTEKIPVLIMTSIQESQHVLKTTILAMGANDFINKPFKADELCRRVEHLLLESANA